MVRRVLFGGFLCGVLAGCALTAWVEDAFGFVANTVFPAQVQKVGDSCVGRKPTSAIVRLTNVQREQVEKKGSAEITLDQSEIVTKLRPFFPNITGKARIHAEHLSNLLIVEGVGKQLRSVSQAGNQRPILAVYINHAQRAELLHQQAMWIDLSVPTEAQVFVKKSHPHLSRIRIYARASHLINAVQISPIGGIRAEMLNSNPPASIVAIQAPETVGMQVPQVIGIQAPEVVGSAPPETGLFGCLMCIESVGHLQLGLVEHLGDAEVRQLDPPVLGDQDVLGADVAVYDVVAGAVRAAEVVGVLEPGQDLQRDEAAGVGRDDHPPVSAVVSDGREVVAPSW